MADFNITISNTLNVFGPQKTSRWNSMVWGTGFWGYGDFDLITTIDKVITNSLSLSGANLTLNPTKVISNSIAVSGDMLSENISDSAGYNLIFGSSKNAESRPLTSYTSIDSGTATYTQVASPGTTWSEQT